MIVFAVLAVLETLVPSQLLCREFIGRTPRWTNEVGPSRANGVEASSRQNEVQPSGRANEVKASRTNAPSQNSKCPKIQQPHPHNGRRPHTQTRRLYRPSLSLEVSKSHEFLNEFPNCFTFSLPSPSICHRSPRSLNFLKFAS